MTDDEFKRLLEMYEELRELKEFAKAIKKEVGEKEIAGLASGEAK